MVNAKKFKMDKIKISEYYIYNDQIYKVYDFDVRYLQVKVINISNNYKDRILLEKFIKYSKKIDFF